MHSTWLPVRIPDYDETDIWECPDCGWAVQLECDTPVEHKYFYCPECGRRRITEG